MKRLFLLLGAVGFAGAACVVPVVRVHADGTLPADQPQVAVFGQGPAFGFYDHQQQPLGGGYSGVLGSVQLYVRLKSPGVPVLFQLCDTDPGNDAFCRYVDMAKTISVTSTLPGGATEGWITFAFPGGVDLSRYAFLHAAFCEYFPSVGNVPGTDTENGCSNSGGAGVAFSGFTTDGVERPSGWPPYGIYWTMKFFAASTTPPAPQREPVVIVPGIMGSRLNRVADGVEAWPNADKMFSPLDFSDAYLDDLKMDAAGHGTVPLAVGDVVRSVRFLSADASFYHNLIDVFLNDGYTEGVDLFVAPYDWRTDLRDATSSLAAVVARAVKNAPDEKIAIVAHSMGGLLVKQYLAGVADPSFADKVIMVGVPQLGAPKDFTVLNYGDHVILDWLGNLGVNANEIKSIAQNMPAVYELLPSRQFIEKNGGYVEDLRGGKSGILGYDATAQAMKADASDARNAGLLAAADVFHAGIDGHTVNGTHVYNIVGCLSPTVSGFKLRDGGDVDVVRATGDGTVPASSAMASSEGEENYFVLGNETGIDHNGLVNDARPLAVIKAIVDGTVSGMFIPPGISRAVADCNESRGSMANVLTTVEWSTHSPVALHVYDAAGRHTGPGPDGIPENGIPGSSYESIGENSFVLAPAGAGPYRVIAQGLASGTFRMAVNGYYGASIAPDKHAEYVRIPLLGASTTAEMDFSGFDGNMGLKLDRNGDGVVDITVMPGASSTPPVPPAPAATSSRITLEALADTYIDRRAPYANFGKEKILYADGLSERRVLVRFDDLALRDAIGTSTVTSARLIFTLTGAVVGAPAAGKKENRPASRTIMDVFRLTAPWSELGATWRCPEGAVADRHKEACKKRDWAMDGMRFPFLAKLFSSGTVIANNATGTVALDVTAEVKKIIKKSVANNGWMAAFRGKGEAVFSSREGGYAPALVVDYAIMQK